MKNTQFIAIIVLITLWFASVHFSFYNQTDKIVWKILAIEYDKVGWMENYVKINKITKEQVITWLEQYEAQNWIIDTESNTGTISNSKTISLEEAKKVVWENTFILWNPDAEITYIEYSDLECPFCKKLHESWTIEKVLESYEWKVNFIFKQFPLGFHAQAQMEAEAALCVWDIAWSDKYYEFITNVFKESKTNWLSYDIESIWVLAENMWIDKSKLTACINAWTNKDLAKAQADEWASLFWITWTPWNVFLNNKTGEWESLPGAYPFESFKQKIDSLIK
jgi:protein-disulfide isomerase